MMYSEIRMESFCPQLAEGDTSIHPRRMALSLEYIVDHGQVGPDDLKS